MANPKREAAETLAAFKELIDTELFPPEKAKAAEIHTTLARLFGEFRQEKGSLREKLENAEKDLPSLREKVTKLEAALVETRAALNQRDNQLASAQSALKQEQAARLAIADPQDRLERLDLLPPWTKREALAAAMASPEREVRRQQLLRLVPKYVPSLRNDIDPKRFDGTMSTHQDAFAFDYLADEYTLLGMCVKYAGEFGLDVTISGKNGELAGGVGRRIERVMRRVAICVIDPNPPGNAPLLPVANDPWSLFDEIDAKAKKHWKAGDTEPAELAAWPDIARRYGLPGITDQASPADREKIARLVAEAQKHSRDPAAYPAALRTMCSTIASMPGWEAVGQELLRRHDEIERAFGTDALPASESNKEPPNG